MQYSRHHQSAVQYSRHHQVAVQYSRHVHLDERVIVCLNKLFRQLRVQPTGVVNVHEHVAHLTSGSLGGRRLECVGVGQRVREGEAEG